MDATKTKLVGVTIPEEWYDQIVTRLEPLQNVQDYIRQLIEKDLAEVKQ